jgi:hypothetical protein
LPMGKAKKPAEWTLGLRLGLGRTTQN